MDRTAVVDVATKYLHGLKGEGVNAIPLGPDISLTENGKIVARGPRDVRKRLESNSQAVKEIHITRWVVEGGDVIALCQLDTNDGRVQFLSQYLRVYDSLIREAQVNFGRRPTAEEIERYRQARAAQAKAA